MAEVDCEKRIKGIMAHIAPFCGKPATTEIDGKKLCRKCAASERRTRTKTDNRRKVEAEQEGRVAGWNERMERAAKTLGVSAHLDMLGMNYVERVTISLQDFERLATVNGKRS